MDKVILIFIVSGFAFGVSCSNRPDYTAEIKTIDSLQTEIRKSMEECKKLDTNWVVPVTVKADGIMIDIKQYYNPDSIMPEEMKIISYYKGFRKVGKRFMGQRKEFLKGMEKSLKQLDDLKTDAENGVLKKEDLDKYLIEEKLVTTDLLFQFNDFKYTSREVLRNYDSLTPMIERIIEVYRGDKDSLQQEGEKK